MPFIDIKTNKQVTKNEEIALKEALGQAIAILPGKSETWLMLDIHDGCRKTSERAGSVRLSIKGDAYQKFCEFQPQSEISSYLT